jgi:4-hydroxybenzoate polyprenyltransferase
MSAVINTYIAAPWKEVIVVYRLVITDFMAGFLPGIVFWGAASFQYEMSWLERLFRFCLVLVNSLFYILTFTLANQIVGVEEDRRNGKIHRPLVSGLITMRGAIIRYKIYLFTYISFSALLSPTLFWLTTAWVMAFSLCNFAKFSRIWYCKNLMNGIGTLSMLGTAWYLAGWEISAMAWSWIIGLSITISWVAGLQDFRDIEGDKAVGRRTYPMVFGVSRARKLLIATFILLPIWTHYFIYPLTANWWTPWLEVVPLGISWLIAFRLAKYHTPREDQITYFWLPRWYVSVLGSAVVYFAIQYLI